MFPFTPQRETVNHDATTSTVKETGRGRITCNISQRKLKLQEILMCFWTRHIYDSRFERAGSICYVSNEYIFSKNGLSWLFFFHKLRIASRR